jgi:hypothetical protein
MKKLEVTMITTHVDSHGEKFAEEGLESFVASINESYLPFTVEHDIRNTPIGRVTSATIVPLDDGEFAVKGTCEIFERGDTLFSAQGDGRKIRVKSEEIPTFDIHYDLSYETEEGRKLLKALSELSTESRTEVQVKKSVVPISTFVIAAGTFAGLAVASHFFGKLGDDLYAGLKNVLKSHFGSRKEATERLLDFQFTTKIDGEAVEIHVLLTNPTQEEIESLFNCRFGDLDSYLSGFGDLGSVARLVVDYKDGRLVTLYGLRADCVPLTFRRASSKQ